MSNNYTVYHLHSEVSLLDSCTNYKLYIDKAVELGQKAIAFSEHGNIYNWIEKKMYANKCGLKYIHACEVYLTEKLYWYDLSSVSYSTKAELDKWIEDNKYKVRDNYHTILIAKDEIGFKELNELIDLSTRPDHFYYKPRLTFEEFFNISSHIYKISACLASPLSKYPSSKNADKEIYDKLLQSYDYYEIQPHNAHEQMHYNKMLYMASQQYGIPLIAGTDTHSIDSYKAECRNLLKIAKGAEYADEDAYDLTYKSYDELVQMFKVQNALPMDVVLDAIENTNRMADTVKDFELDTSFKYPVLYNDEEAVFKKRINDMYKDKLNRGVIQPDPKYKQMVREEMRVFKKIGMVGFMLFMSELVSWCWKNNIPVGFCRGSVGGSMIAYLTDIIDVNPLTWGTMFSRFANEDRKEIGDIDIDLAPSQRHLVYEHIIEEFGSDKTAYVLAIGTISDKGTIDEIGRALANKWQKVNGKDDNNNPYSLKRIADIKKEYDNDPEATKNKYKDIFYYFDGLVNTAISQSIHPAGIIVSPVTLPDNYGTFWNDGKRILSINMEEIHEVSLVKYDLLGLKNVEIIKDCCELAGIKYPKSHELDWDDSKVWDHIADSPVGIFQMESKFAYDSMKKMSCRSVNDLSLVNSAIRPSGESYRDRLLAGEWNKNPSKLIDDVLSASRGFLAYQEQVISFLQNVCGLSGSEADNVRRAIGRKQMDRLQAALPQILDGYCSKSDKPKQEAEVEAKTFLQIIEDSSNYMFGFNHSTGYSMIGYLCAYLRYYYPSEFVTAYLNNANSDDDINNGTDLAKQLGITIHPIKFRHSVARYSCDKSNIYKGIASIKFCNSQIADELYALKDNIYQTFIDLLIDINNTSVNSRQLEILTKLDFFSEFGHPNMLLKQIELFNTINGKKQFKKDKLPSIGLSEELVRKWAEKETDKMFTKVNTAGMLSELVDTMTYPDTLTKHYLAYEIDCLGYVTYTDNNADKHLYCVTTFNDGKILVSAELHEIYSGKSRKVKMWRSDYDRCEFGLGDVLYVHSVDKKPKREPTGEINPATGKKIYRDVPGEYEFWLKGYYVT